MSDELYGDLPPSVASPARRALTAAGYRKIAELDGASVADLRKLHGMGPRAVRLIEDMLQTEGMSLGPGEIDR